MCAKVKQEAQNPLILRCHRIMEAFAKSDDERDFYIDRLEGFLIYVDLDKSEEELESLEKELKLQADRYCAIPKLSFYETKKIMEGFVNEKVYDIDTKEKLIDIIQSKEARENFLEFIYDQHTEQEKWQQYYQERSRIRIIEWLRQNHFHFVFEEDLDLSASLIEKLKQSLFQIKVGKDILNARKVLVSKAKTYYSSEALNPRPKRGRPPKQAVKPMIEPQMSLDVYTTVPQVVLPFLFSPDLQSSSNLSAFSSKFDSEEGFVQKKIGEEESLTKKLAALRSLSSRWLDNESKAAAKPAVDSFDDSFDDEDEDEEIAKVKPTKSKTKPSPSKASTKSIKKIAKKAAPIKQEKAKAKRIMPIQRKVATSSKGLKKLLPKKRKS